MGYAVRLQVFEGPLDLLLHLVEANRVDIYDIPVAEITAQYLRYLQDMAAVDLEAGAEFVVMAATLLEIKARMLLPVPAATEPEEPDPRRELVERLVRYRQFKRAAGYLQELTQAQAQRFLRGGKVAAGDPMSAPVAPERLARALWALLRVPVPPGELARSRFSVRQKMRDILRLLRQHPTGLPFRILLPARPGRGEVVVTFLAVLELCRLARITVRQERPFADILVFPGQQEGIVAERVAGGGREGGREGRGETR